MTKLLDIQNVRGVLIIANDSHRHMNDLFFIKEMRRSTRLLADTYHLMLEKTDPEWLNLYERISKETLEVNRSSGGKAEVDRLSNTIREK